MYQSFVDPLWHGPAWDDGDRAGLLMRRARFVAMEYETGCADVYKRLAAEYAALDNAHHYDRIVLWCEHDVYDQIALIRLLHAFVHPVFHGRIWAVPADGVQHFGAMDIPALAALRGAEECIDAARIAAGSACWQTFSTFEDPRALRDASAHPWPWPHLNAALMRLLEERPALPDHLARSERTALQVMADGANTLGGIMRASHVLDPVFSISDLALHAALRRMEDALVQNENDTWTMTQQGLSVLSGSPYAAAAPRWIGGTRFSPTRGKISS